MNRAALLLFATLVGCGSAAAAPIIEAGGGDENLGDANVVGDANVPEAPVMYDVSGTIVDGSDAGWAGANVQVCNEALCNLGSTNQSGAFSVAVPPGGGYHVIARPATSDPRETSAGIGIVGNVAADVAVGSIAIPLMGTKVELAVDAGVQVVSVASGLTLAVTASDLAFENDAYVAGAAVASTSWPAFGLVGQTVLAMWALDPWGTRANTGDTIGVTLANNFGLVAGDVVSVYAVNELTAELGTASQGVVSSDGTAITGATVDRVTWIVVSHTP